MNSPTRTRFQLDLMDRLDQRDAKWLDAFALARHALELKGVRCLTCGHRLWPGSGRIYCNDTCRRRWLRRRERWKAKLREVDEPCPFCGDRTEV